MPSTSGAALAVPSNLAVVDLAPKAASLREEVVAGLSQPRKSLPPKLFYDARGSELFAAICRTSAYYLTRTETGNPHAPRGRHRRRAGSRLRRAGAGGG